MTKRNLSFQEVVSPVSWVSFKFFPLNPADWLTLLFFFCLFLFVSIRIPLFVLSFLESIDSEISSWRMGVQASCFDPSRHGHIQSSPLTDRIKQVMEKHFAFRSNFGFQFDSSVCSGSHQIFQTSLIFPILSANHQTHFPLPSSQGLCLFSNFRLIENLWLAGGIQSILSLSPNRFTNWRE